MSLWRQKDSITAHLVNLTNPMMPKEPVRKLIPISEQRVRIHIPAGGRVNRVQFLVSDRKPVWRQSGKIVDLVVPSVELHEVIALDLT